MNIFDLLLLVAAIAAGYFFYQRKKRKAEKAGQQAAPTSTPTVPMTVQSAPTVRLCKFVAVHIDGIPNGLPFGENWDSSTLNLAMMTAGYEANEEIRTLCDTGFCITSVTPMMFRDDMMVLCITAGKA